MITKRFYGMGKLKRIVYASTAMREEDFADLFRNSPKMPGQQAQRFNRLMIKGLAKNDVDVVVISAPPVNRSNCPSRVANLGKRRDGRICWRYLPVINVRGIKNAVVMLHSFLTAFFSSIGRDAAVVCDVLNISVSLGAVSAGRLLGKRCVGIVTDVPELMVSGHTERMLKYCYRVIGKCTDYVFLTEAMNDRLNPKGKPFTVVEAVCNEDMEYHIPDGSDKKTSCLYAGLLDAEYGVKDMVDAFIKADIPDCTMHICGSGPYTEELTRVVSENSNIVYHGTLLNHEVVALEKEVSLLINPRPSSGEFTKYSFPSKNMEYMTSGTPVLANKLPGIPEEYYDYIYTFSGESVDEMAESMKAVFAEPQSAWNKKGLDAYRFVTEQKNSRAQAKKVLQLVEASIKKRS